MKLKEIKDIDGVFNARDKSVNRYSVEFTVTQYNKDGSLEYPDQTYCTLSEAIAYCKEVYNTNIEYMEITLETTAWYWNEQHAEGDIPDTIGEVTVAYYSE